ncbi:MAG: tetratricopeptide repeat protein [Planctomycetes bacterium]|nr:tetratricopeptide repeat protein [Planctomycetota bacterium]
MTRPRTLLLSLLLPLTTALHAQDPALEAKRLRKEADAAVQSGDFTTAAASFRKLTEATPDDAGAWLMLGYSLHAAGKLDEALPIHEKAAGMAGAAPVAAYNAACVHALQHRPDEAFVWLEKAAAGGFSDGKQLSSDTDLDSLRKDDRFAKVAKVVEANAAKAMTAFAVASERRGARVAWFGRQGSPGQIGLDYTPVPWNDEYADLVASGRLKNKKWRLGGDFWTTLDTSMDVVFGTTTVPAGYYYLTLEQRDGDAYVLALHDAATAKKQKLDPVFAGNLKGGIEVALAHATLTEKAARLEIDIALTPGSQTAGALSIRFGTHELSAPMQMKVE